MGEPRRFSIPGGRRAWFVLLALVYVVTFFVAERLAFEAVKDEKHFWESTQLLVGPFPPTKETLHAIPEVVTPLSFVIWGQLERVTGAGIFAPRLLNLLLSAAIVFSLAWRARDDDEVPMLAAIGVLSFPYHLALSVHLYTDVMAAFFVYLGFRALESRRMVWAAVALTAGVATRQYMVVFPAALAAQIAWEGWFGDRRRWRDAWPAIVAGLSLLGWFAFYGGLSSPAGLDRWIAPYPAPMMSAFDFMIEYGLYALACIGVYFVIPSTCCSAPGTETGATGGIS